MTNNGRAIIVFNIFYSPDTKVLDYILGALTLLHKNTHTVHIAKNLARSYAEHFTQLGFLRCIFNLFLISLFPFKVFSCLEARGATSKCNRDNC